MPEAHPRPPVGAGASPDPGPLTEPVSTARGSGASQGSPQRHGAIDLLRAVAVLLVINDHWQDRFARPGATQSLIQLAFDYCGWVGVDLFFVLSGFLVSGLLFSEYRNRGTISAGRFLIRRGFKIYPGFYALLAVFVGIWALDGDLPWKKVAAEALFVQNYLPGMFGHTWSLAVEEHFYIGLALMLGVLARRGIIERTRSMVGLLLGSIAVVGAMRVVNAILRPWLDVYSPDFPLGAQYASSHLRADGLLLGVLLSYLAQFHRDRTMAFCLRWQSPLRYAGGAVVFAVAPWLSLRHPTLYPTNHFWLGTVGFTLLYCGWASVLMGFVTVEHLSGRGWQRLLLWIGQRSYSIYLWHLVAARLMLRVVRGTSLEAFPHLSLVLYSIAAVGLGAVAAALIELPMLRVRDRWFPTRTRGGAGARVSGASSVVA